MKRQAWLVAVGSGEDQIADRWIEQRPELLRRWPIAKKTPSGIKRNDLLIYYAAGHKRLLAIARVSGDGADAVEGVFVQVLLAVPTVALAPDWSALEKAPESIEGQRAILLTDAEYERGRQAIMARTALA